MEGQIFLAIVTILLFGNSNAQNSACSGYADVVFVVDSSDSVGQNDYKKEIELIKQTVNKMNIGPQGLHVGLVTYGSQPQAVFNLKDHGTAAAISNALDSAQFVGGNENMLDALQLAKNQMFTPAAGVRDKTSRIVVHVTGGHSSNEALTKLRAEELRANDIDVYSVGIGGGVKLSELTGIASDPKTRYLYTADNFDSAQALADVLGPKICNEIPEDPQFLPPPTGCLQKADIMFLLDSSSSIGQTNFQKLEDFLKNTVKDLDIGPDKVRVGLMQYSSFPSLEFPLNMHGSRYDVLKAIDQVGYMGGGANTADALKYMRQLAFSQNSGARADVPRIAVVLTDGSSANSAAVSTEANNARRDNIGLISVGVGPNVNTGELQAIADDPDSAHMFNPQDYSSLAGISKQIIDAACSVQSTSPPLTTAQPGATTAPDPCQDKVTTCGNYGSDLCTGTYKEWAKVNCARYCGVCSPLYTTAPPVCNDLRTDCQNFGISSCSGSYRPYMEKNCARYCGYCGLDTQSIGFYGNCAYKGMTYSTGQKWTDGCDYECVCEDGNTGKYRCYNKCPVYHNLPADCTLVKDPSKCCLQPQCNFDQKVGTTQGVNKGSKNGIDTCVYNGKNYYQDQQWEDGCTAQCICVDASTGRHECHDLCPTFTRLPSYCHLEQKPGDCCPTPICEFQNQQGTFTGLGSISSNGIGSSPATLPPCDNKLSNCALYGKPACTQYKTWAYDNCRDFCGLCGTGPAPGPDDKCLYNGVQYSQDDSWFVGSDKQCTCENAVSGYYRCTSLCPTYTNLPPTCTTSMVAGQTCEVVSCPSGTFIASSTNLATLGNGGNIQKGPSSSFAPPTLPSGAQAPPGTGGPADQAPKLNGCLYKGQLYVQGQRWNDGCTSSCECLDAATGRTKCRQRCPDYAAVPQGCTMVSDPDEPCCVKPKCSDPNVIPVPHFKPYTTNNKPVAPPSDKERFTGTGGFLGPNSGQATFVQTGTTIPPPTVGNFVTGGIGKCDYKGKDYLQGEIWKDGCDYNCVCDDASFGHYTCTEICVVYINIPKPYCNLIQDPANPCCQIPSCVWSRPYQKFTDYLVVNPTTPVAKSTEAPPTPAFAFCEYKGKSYDENQVWYDGCDYKCTCEEPSTNKYRCESRCADFPNVAANCKFVPDTEDPTCCKVPECPTPAPLPGASPEPTPTSVPGVITGGVTPGTSSGNPKGYCEYNENRYQQGEQWDNGCEYTCVCEDSVTGKYKCTEKCARYTDLAPNCRLVDDFTNPCCKVPRCDANPNPQSTIAPDQNNPQTLKPGDKSFCVYNGVQYTWGQQWVDGCDKKCQCDNADTGVYSCTERCITYDSLPPECKLVTDPSDSCCLVPECSTPAPVNTPAPPPGSGTTKVPGQVPGSNPPVTATDAPTPTAVTGKVTGYANIPTAAPGPNGETATPPTLTYCEYKGTRYNQGEKWDDGCTFLCECVNALVGKYQCNERCPRYVNLPKGCRLVKDPSNPCCEMPDCQPVPQTPTTTLAPGVTKVPTTVSGPTPAPKGVCVYKRQSYTQGQKWFDGCEYACECENADLGLYRCDNRCPSYSTIPSGCHFEDDPTDPFCCKVIKCDIPQTLNNQTGTGLIPTPPPAIKEGGYATPVPSRPDPNSPPPLPGQTTQSPVPKGVCVYKGRQYSQGSKWQDGCDYNCECVDGTGRYICTEICPSLGKLPSVCILIPDVNKPCCKTSYCDFTKTTILPPVKTTTPQPNPFYTPTPKPRKDVCVYNGVAFNQGQQWNDGCDLICTCENSTTGFYRCNQRCAQFSSALDPNCQMVTDPRDSCCKIPSCMPTANPVPNPTGAPDPNNPGKTLPPPTNGPNPVPFTYQTPKPGKIDGFLVPPSPFPVPDPNNPGSTIIPTQAPGCLYGGVLYTNGQKWQDGCQYTCMCVDDVTGKYTCTERCPVYPSIPSYCRLINDPKDACCKIPDCLPPGGNTPTLSPGQVTNPPNPNQSPTPSPPPRDVCVYNNVQYTQGQQWNDGCDKVCVCDDAKTGFYRCSSRCPQYTVPSGCSLIPDPNDPACCEVPQCISVPSPNDIPTPGPTKTYTNLPVGKVTGEAPIPTPPTLVPGQSTQKPQEGCLYKNKVYAQGQQWQDGCQFTCVCDDGMTGKYTCSQRCPATGALPAQCKLVQDPTDFCCMVPACDFSQTPTPGIMPVITVTPTPAGQTPGPGNTPQPTPPAFCVYNGVPYGQGQTWKDGCSTTCRCENAMQNSYSCFDRCPTYQLQTGCKLVTDPNDLCCQVPQCLDTPAPNPTPAPTPFPNGTYPSPGTFSTPVPHPVPVPNKPGTIVGTPPPQQRTGFCEFKGNQYKTGDKWIDGCDFNCECIDQMSGVYQCTQRCSPYPSIPPTCVKVQDPNDACCQVPYCPGVVNPTPSVGVPVPGGSPTASPYPTATPYPTLFPPQPSTNAPPTGSVPFPTDVCVYMGKSYTQGQKWNIGCEKTCVCEDGKTGGYSCTDRCPDYSNMMSANGKRATTGNCILVPDPKDPVCCKAPQCNPGPNPNPTPTGVIGVVTGSHITPTPNPMPTPYPPTGPTTPAPTPACVYKGSRYGKGQRWQDGCDYDCECLDDMTGNYKCIDKCPSFPNLPVTCKLVYDPQNPCCEKPECPPPTTVGPNGQTPTPGNTPSPDVCVFNGVPYRQGQTWKVGCDKVCVCEDAATKRINCDDRCPSFQSIPPGCQLTTDPQDSCCQTLDCPVPAIGQPITPLPPSYVTGVSVPAQNPTPFSGGVSDICVYQGKVYKQGEKWQDGCTFTCVCMDASQGKYMCTDRCPSYPTLPASCTLIQDPQKACCKIPFCPATPAPVPTLNPQNPTPTGPGIIPTSVPVPPDTCVYNGQMYKQGQKWYDGCNKICVCEDASMNFYRCEDRCAVYPQVPQGCSLVPDPKDPTCCEKPECPVQVGPNPTSGFVPTPSNPTPGSVTGVGLIPTPAPTPSVGPGSTQPPTLQPPLPKTGCYYDSKVYKQGDKWQVGCDYTCVCSDGITGKYSCDNLCPPLPSNLPPECRAVQDPQQPCCGRVYCDTVNPTPQFPTPTVDPSQNPQVYTPGPTTSFNGQQGYCVYNGVYYQQDQTWQDGCSKTCKCEDVNTGYYSCRERCSSFDNLPATCKLIADPSDPCCVVPDCSSDIPTPAPTGPNGQTLSPPIGPTPPLIIKPSPAPVGSFIGTGTGKGGSCMYNGQAYGKGQIWTDGCDFKCECIDAIRGQFRCTDRCPQYYNQLPQECYYQQSLTDQCCQEAICNFGTTLTPRPSNTPSTTQRPTIIVTLSPDMCVYTNNKTYSQGSTWNDGCSGTCKCVDSITNNYVCTQRCPVYSNLPQECTLTPDPSDSCCMQPTCTGTLTPMIGGGGPTQSPTLAPSVTNVLPLGTHTTLTGSELPKPGTPGGTVFGKRVGCVYKGDLHRQGDRWNDCCDYVCSCVDENNGMYKCTSKCPQLPPLPTYCNKVNIPGQCCPTVSCNLPGKGAYSPVPELTPDLIPTPGPVPSPGQTTPATYVIGTGGSTTGGTQYPGGGSPIPSGVTTGQLTDKCVSKDNKMYNQGESWLQDCDFNCTCIDGRSGYFECVPLCPKYDQLPKECYLEQSSGCCLQPKCTDVNGQPVDPIANPGAFPVVGTVSGGFTGFRPGFLSNTHTGISQPGCYYKSVFYQEGDKWDDGCDFSCECKDGQQRSFQCIPKCTKYTVIPPGYQLIPDPQGCCEILTSSKTTQQTPNVDPKCKDAIPDCDLYGAQGRDGCVGQYTEWARRNCAVTCGYCPTIASPTVSSTPPSTCKDTIPNCKDYGLSACTGAYKPWAETYCQAYCNLCPQSTPASNAMCHDLLPNCQTIGSFYCQGIYVDWARINCNATCNLCKTSIIDGIESGLSGHGTIGPIVTGTNETFGSRSKTGWATLLKGVSGAPGDLLGTWLSPSTVNAKNPVAMLLDNQLKENYKPGLSNFWDECKFELVKLSVMSNYQEKAYIIFNATGSNKMNWFDPSRIVNSTYSDLKGANFDTFSARGDPNTGRHFIITEQTQSCDVKGWIMISTKSDCFFERGDQPGFHYSTTGQSERFGFGTQRADIFVISGYGGKCFYNAGNDSVTVNKPSRPVCEYKGSDYGTGDNWQDGCEKNCTCVDANVGFYKCVDLCPKIQNLPSGCHMEKKLGECCGKVVCGGGPGTGCYYKGQFYSQDQKWDDGCDYNCECVDASQGFYQCKAKCLTFNNLPTECKLLAPPLGKCCPTVSCPPGIVVNYPAGYVQQ